MTVLGQQSFLANTVNEASLFRYEVSRQKITENIEKARILRDYRTPRTLRYMTSLLLYSAPFGLAPHFSSYCEDHEKTCVSAYFNACCYILVLFCVYNVVGDLESTYDSCGVDDVHFTITEEIMRLHYGTPSAFFSIASDGEYYMHNPARFIKQKNGSIKLPEKEMGVLDSKTMQNEETYVFANKSPDQNFEVATQLVRCTLDSPKVVADTVFNITGNVGTAAVGAGQVIKRSLSSLPPLSNEAGTYQPVNAVNMNQHDYLEPRPSTPL